MTEYRVVKMPKAVYDRLVAIRNGMLGRRPEGATLALGRALKKVLEAYENAERAKPRTRFPGPGEGS